MNTLPTIPRDAPAPPRTILLPHWLTPAFARAWLKRSAKDQDRPGLAARPRAGQHYSQAERYTAIALRRDWNEHRDYDLAWREPYTGRTLADQVAAQTTKEP